MKVERYRPGRRASPHNPREATGLPPHGTYSKSLCKSSSVSSYGDVKRVSRQDQVALASHPLDLPAVGPFARKNKSASQNAKTLCCLSLLRSRRKREIHSFDDSIRFMVHWYRQTKCIPPNDYATHARQYEHLVHTQPSQAPRSFRRW